MADEEVLLLMLLPRRRRQGKERQPEKRRRSSWVRENFTKRRQQGDYHNLMLENVTGGPKISFQIVQVVSTDGLNQFLTGFARVLKTLENP